MKMKDDTAGLILGGFVVLIGWAVGGFETAVAAFLGVAIGSIISYCRKNEGDK